MNTKKEKFNWWLRIGLSAFVLFTIYAMNFLLNPYSTYWIELQAYNTYELIFDILLTFLFSWLIIEVSIWIAKILNRFLTWTNHPILRFGLQSLFIIASTLLLLFIQVEIFKCTSEDVHLTQQEFLETWQFFFVIIIVSLFVSAVHTGYFLLKRWKTSISEANELQLKTMELKEIALQAELQSLKMQLDPHFMFNNFSTLSELINEDRETAIRFLENLSRVYRYMIQNLKKDMVSLKEEISFVKAYCYLIEIRHGENVKVFFDLNDEALDLYIPPISIQLLVENAIKHNIATQKQPLTITITLENKETVKVSNNLQRITNLFPSTGLGIKNIIDRYRLLSETSLPTIKETSTCFCVTLPLLNNR